MSGGAVALEGIQTILDENKELKEGQEVMARELDVVLQEVKDLRSEVKKFDPFRDIILDEDATTEWKQIAIKNPVTYKYVLTRTKQVYNNTSPFSVAAMTNSMLEWASSPAGFRGVKKLKYGEQESNDASSETKVAGHTPA